MNAKEPVIVRWASASIGRAVLVFLLAGGGTLPGAPPGQKPGAEGNQGGQAAEILFVEAPQLRLGVRAERFPAGSRIMRLNVGAVPNPPVSLTEDFFAASDPKIDFTGTRVLFSAQASPGQPWQIWEMSIDGTNKRQITKCASDCLRGDYLPGGEIVFTAFEKQGRVLTSHLSVAKLDGTEVRRITFGTAAFEVETVLRDGRIVASAPWPLAQQSERDLPRILYTLRPDGTALESFRCEHERQDFQADAAELDDGSVVFVSGSEHDAGGALRQVKRGDPVASSMGTARGTYLSPRPMGTKELIVARRVREIGGGSTRFELYTVTLGSGSLGKRIFGDPQMSVIEPVPVRGHPVPKKYWSTLNAQASTGYFICLDSRSSAEWARNPNRKAIAKVEVFEQDSLTLEEMPLGQAPVEADGSFYVEVPANRPVRFALFDAEGGLIRAERTWIWTRPGEQRGCTGCHGDKSVAPENRWPLTLKRFDTPTPLGGSEHATATSQAN